MKYTRDEVDRIKNSVDPIAYAKHLGIELAQVGSRFRAHCPLHEDKTPSFYFTPQSGSYHCFGCQAHGDLITLARELKGLSFNEAIEDLSKFSNSPAPSPTYCSPLEGSHPPPSFTKETQSLLDDIVRQYQQNLSECKTAQEYLRGRGISDQAIEQFGIGYSGFKRLSYPPSGVDSLQSIGLLNKKRNEAFYARVTIPIRNETGEIVQLYGRSIRDGNFNHRYLQLSHSTLFNPKALQSNEVYLCESVIDTLTLYSQGIENACGIYGTHGFKNSYLNDFVQSKVEHVIIAFDNDTAGNSAAQTTMDRLEACSIKTSRMRLPEGMDVSNVARKATNPHSIYRNIRHQV